MAYFTECPICGAALDPGERCDCDRKHEENRKKYDCLLVEVDGQYELGGFNYGADYTLRQDKL